MPVDTSKYPSNWKQISAAIRERDGHRCKWCGVPNGERGARDQHDQWHEESAIHNLNSSIGESLFGEFPKVIKIVLTVAHIDHDTTNNSEDNLAALCQRCHLRHDAKQHAANAKRTRDKKRRAALRETGQLDLFEI